MSYDINVEMDRIDSVIANGRYKADNESLTDYEVPDWYRKAKFGIFVHWGIYSEAAFANEWYPRNMYEKDSREFVHHVETFGPHSKTGYADYVDRFKGEHFNPDEWISLFKKAGAEYVIPVAEHHDGFQMYKSRLSHWNAAEKGPKRDVILEVKEAAARAGLTFGTSSHRIEHWWFMGGGRRFDSDIKGEFKRGDFYWPSMDMEDKSQFDIFAEPAPSKEYMEDWLIRTCEIVDRFMPRVLYFDWWIEHSAARPYLKKAMAYYYNKMDEAGLAGVINYKHDEFPWGSAVPDVERGQFADIKPFIWQTDAPIGFKSWGYIPDNEYKKADDIIRTLVDVVSKNGRMLLNVGPKGDGTITEEETSVLLDMGKWLKANGEAIYGAKPYRVFGEGETFLAEGGFNDGDKLDFSSRDIRFTSNNGNIYAIAMKAAEDGN